MALPNPYATLLREYSTFVFNEQDVFKFYRNGGGGWEEFFLTRMNSRPTKHILEIGCSNATFLSGIAKANPGAAFIGMDWKFKVIFKGAKRAEQEKITNLALLRGRAQELGKVFGAGELDEIWIFFPDPWAKKGQLKHRLMREEFLKEAHHVLRPGGRIYFKTDHPGYFQWVLALLGEPEPDLPEYSAATPLEKNRRSRQIEVRRLERQHLPAVSDKARQLFKLDYFTTDYWAGTRPPSLFSQELTLFERLFVKDQLPIYYLELQKQ